MRFPTGTRPTFAYLAILPLQTLRALLMSRCLLFSQEVGDIRSGTRLFDWGSEMIPFSNERSSRARQVGPAMSSILTTSLYLGSDLQAHRFEILGSSAFCLHSTDLDYFWLSFGSLTDPVPVNVDRSGEPWVRLRDRNFCHYSSTLGSLWTPVPFPAVSILKLTKPFSRSWHVALTLTIPVSRLCLAL